MLNLYQAHGGSSEITLVKPVHPEIAARVLKRASDLLRRRGYDYIADTLVRYSFVLWEGTNGFGDEFLVLHAKTPPARYAELYDMNDEPEHGHRFGQIATALYEADSKVRFIAASLSDSSEPAAVPAPSPLTTSDTLERALVEVERALADGHPEVGVDRVHTSLHAYLREKVDAAGLTAATGLSVDDLFQLLRNSHPKLQPTGPRSGDITNILRGIARILDALDPLRNRASLAHPPEETLLPDAEAMLVINAVRTLMHYLERRLRG